MGEITGYVVAKTLNSSQMSWPFTKLDRYLWRQSLLAALLFTGALTLIVWITQSLKLVDFIVNRGVPVSTFGYLAVLTIPALLPLVLPLTMFAAVMFTLYRLSSDSELVALHAGGVSAWRIARAPLLLAFTASIFTASLTLWISPWSIGEFKNLQFRLRNDYSMTLLEEGVFAQVAKGITVYVRERQRDGSLNGIIVHDNRDSTRPVTVFAQRGNVMTQSGNPIISVVNGSRQVMDKNTGAVTMLYFDSYTLNLQQILNQDNTTRSANPKEMTLADLLNPDPSLPRNAQLRQLSIGHQRLLMPLNILVFTLLALAVFRDCLPRRQSLGQRIAVGVFGMVGLQAIILLTYNAIGINSALHPLWLAAAYALPCIAIVGGIIYLRPYAGRNIKIDPTPRGQNAPA